MIKIELFITFGIIIVQVLFFLFTLEKLRKLQFLFPVIYSSSDKPLRILRKNFRRNAFLNNNTEVNESYATEVIESEGSYSFDMQFVKLIRTTNEYLRNSKGKFDFSVLRSIAERVSENVEQKATALISLPLYIGLMGTFLGVIIGLITLFREGEITDNSITGFLGGILIAMGASFFGLLLTTINNHINYSRYRATLNENKNDYYSFLESELSPPKAEDFSDSVTMLKANLDAFNQEFSENIGSFKGTISLITDNILLQKEFLDQVEKVGIKQLTAGNIEIFNKVQDSTKTFNALVDYAGSLYSAVTGSAQVADKISALFDRVSNFEKVVNKIAESASKNDEIGTIVLQYIQDHLDSLYQRKEMIREYVEASDESLKQFLAEERKSIEEIVRHTYERMEILGVDKKSLLSKRVRKNENGEEVEERIEKSENSESIDSVLQSINQSLEQINKKLMPSVFRPVEFFRHIFRNLIDSKNPKK